jgi:hypothetical protein
MLMHDSYPHPLIDDNHKKKGSGNTVPKLQYSNPTFVLYLLIMVDEEVHHPPRPFFLHRIVTGRHCRTNLTNDVL